VKEIIMSKSKESLIYNDKTIWSWCKVRNLENGKRGFKEVVYTTPKNGKPKPYSPQTFPVGRCEVFRPEKREDNYLAPYFIPTDAEQLVDTWLLKDGQYFIKDGVTYDSEYGIHFSTSATTLGCIRIAEKQDLLDLVDWINKVMNEGEKVYLTVMS